jgi:hypothetical protein
MPVQVPQTLDKRDTVHVPISVTDLHSVPSPTVLLNTQTYNFILNLIYYWCVGTICVKDRFFARRLKNSRIFFRVKKMIETLLSYIRVSKEHGSAVRVLTPGRRMGKWRCISTYCYTRPWVGMSCQLYSLAALFPAPTGLEATEKRKVYLAEIRSMLLRSSNT